MDDNWLVETWVYLMANGKIPAWMGLEIFIQEWEKYDGNFQKVQNMQKDM